MTPLTRGTWKSQIHGQNAEVVTGGGRQWGGRGDMYPLVCDGYRLSVG